ncbi:BrnA antitoxin family protein [soil metagenome]
MSESDLKRNSETNWARVEAMTDEEIDTSDIPPLDEAFFTAAKLRLPRGKVPIVISVDADVAEWFKAQGEEYQSLINAALRIYAEAHKESRR